MARPNDEEATTRPHVPGHAPALEHGQDVSLDEYLGRDDTKRYGKVRVSGDRRLTIAAVTDDELDLCQQMATKPDSKAGVRGATKFDSLMFKRYLASYSLAKVKADGDSARAEVMMGEILPLIANKLSGDVITISNAILKLSGFTEDGDPIVDDLVGNSASAN